MSSGYSGRYQSRLLNFVHQQTRRLTQQWDHTFRHLQVATKWGVELLLYPVYLLLNPTESAGKTLEGQEPKARLKLQPETPPTVDTPIQQVLEAVKSLPSQSDEAEPVKTSAPLKFLGFLWSKLLRHPPTKTLISQKSPENIQPYLPVMRGIATNLVSRNLVLVTADNQILDILTPQQQLKLEARIIWEVGNYWHSWQLATNQPKSQILPNIARIFRKITGQISANMLSLPEGTPNNLLNTNKLIAFLDKSIANWESKALLPVQQRSQKIIRVAQTQLNIFVYGKEQVDARGNIAVNSDGLETQILNIPALIEAAINYFFGVGKDKKIGQGNSVVKPQKQLTDNRRLPNQDLAKNSWLNFSDVFGNSGTLAKKPVSSRNLSESKQKSSRQLTRTSRNAVKSSENLNSQAITENHHNSQVEAKPDWIEVEATFVGYDKHPLEQLLEWLDHAILWLEEIIVKVYQFFQRLWRGK
ncbi:MULTISPECIES: hypothetical protein [Cyanophyceae]|uniref:hypothetical protein n=1 Tax=Cyanophyceae TaxID=3028117 RepID=UPI00232BF670|nr:MULTISPECIES: hypothetical protein [Cyanophyceae]MDB9358609.1 hypothetical protein [Nodularia spumigena CS-587/03]MDB9339375.1 hypothetical protein [Nodularia spumigena CS-589/07]MDB9344465.1 hypothetical protein [Nodularia spumigena CS-588/06]MDB9367715.1 hypothetical protein [Nodularia spumigena CS-586/05]MDB9402646.1 hypothetical protein [Microcystis aeruginosa CS-567/02-A1]